MLKFKKLDFPKNKVYFCSDLHLHHRGISRGVSEWAPEKTRDFQDEIEMTNHLIQNINNKVSWDSLLISAGDWSFNGEDKIEKTRNQINCQNIIHIEGNHCQHFPKYAHLFTEFKQIGYYRVEDVSFIVSHYPLWQWHDQKRSVWNIHGHLHSHEDEILKKIHEYKSIDCGIDNYFKLFGKYEPFSLLEIEEILKNKKITDRHV